MAAAPVLIDTWAFLALVNRDDTWHSQAVDLSRQLHAEGRPLVTTEWILTEFLGGAARAPLRSPAIQSVQQCRNSSRIEVVPASHGDWDQGVDFYQARPGKSWSLVDCLSILLCESRGIAEVFTGDHHFEQAGLRILMKSTT